MLKKRPLCVAVLALTLLLLLLPAELWMKESTWEDRSRAEGLMGTICKMESRTEGQAVYLKSSYPSDKGILLIYFDAEQPFSIGNTIRVEPPYRIRGSLMPGFITRPSMSPGCAVQRMPL